MLLSDVDPQNKSETIANRSPDSAEMLEYWQMISDFIGGQRKMVDAGTKYLPKFPKEKQDRYNFRLSCAKFTNIFKDGLETLTSKPFSDEVKLVEDDGNKIPEELTEFCENVDGAGNNLTVFSAATFFKAVGYAIDWICVDYPEADPNVKTQKDQKDAKIRPYWSHILAQNVLEVKSKMIGGNLAITYIRVLEPESPQRVRVFERLEDGKIGWETWVRSTGSKTEWSKDKSGFLTIDVIPFVPLITGNRNGSSWVIDPPMQDAADLQLTLYKQESGLEYAKVMTAFPMLSANGVTPPKGTDDKPLDLETGPQAVLYAPMQGNGNVGSYAYVEPSANSLKFLSEDIDKTKRDLRELARQPLTAQSGNLTVITTMVAASKASSAVAKWGLLLKDALENAFVITGKWMNIPAETYDPTVYVYDDYDNMTEGGLEALKHARDKGDISPKVYTEELKRRSILNSDYDYEDDAEERLKEIPGGNPDNEPDILPPVNPKKAQVDPAADPERKAVQ